MKQYIDKSALLAEIESKKKYAQILGDNAINGSMQQFYDGMKQGCVDILSSLDTFEVKEVDLVGQLNGFQNFYAHENGGDFPSAIEIAKHFFELGLAQKGE